MLTEEEGSLQRIHHRVASRWYNLIRQNSGLYIKVIISINLSFQGKK
jgi:hypothetical protein